ncbi:hypothetical protein [Alicyclobacillus sp. SO9]|uniref:hypothetical protein n=1 Tax=Alicyclobacillus sp. SO9 TaxID=2665646 RepID=UPI0018E8B728|nr:hypothetical protein [Alicyclobacillus sp. SO9]QQE80256.1 hypothetical protein GI364_07455 [Alicyclobacillus sp. SO9]
MQFNTFIRLGSLAFNVAQDEKVRELLTMVHKGAKRRGFINNEQGYLQQSPSAQSNPPAQSQMAQPAAQSHPIPFSPGTAAKTPTPQGPGAAVPGSLGKYLTADNAKKALKMAGDLGQFLMK